MSFLRRGVMAASASAFFLLIAGLFIAESGFSQTPKGMVTLTASQIPRMPNGKPISLSCAASRAA